MHHPWLARDVRPRLANLWFDVLQITYRCGGWIFDHSGPVAPALVRLSSLAHEHLFPQSFVMSLPNPFRVAGMRLYHDGRRSYHLQMLATGMHDRDVTNLLQRSVQPGMIVVDVGAHIGYFSLLSAQLVGSSGKVFAFEPFPPIAELLRKNIDVNGFRERIQVVPRAVIDASGMRLFYVNPDESMLSSLIERAASYGEESMDRPGGPATPQRRMTRLEVPCTTLDAWAAEENWPRVDLVKIDIEGSEIAAIHGMDELIRRNPQVKVIIELNPRTLTAAGKTLQDMWTTLQTHGLDAIFLLGKSLRPINFPTDIPVVMRAIRRAGNGRVNLLCEIGSSCARALTHDRWYIGFGAKSPETDNPGRRMELSDHPSTPRRPHRHDRGSL